MDFEVRIKHVMEAANFNSHHSAAIVTELNDPSGSA